MFKSQIKKKSLIAVLMLLLALCVGIFALFGIGFNASAEEDNIIYPEDSGCDFIDKETSTIYFTYGKTYHLNYQTYVVGDSRNTFLPEFAVKYALSVINGITEGEVYGFSCELVKFTTRSGEDVDLNSSGNVSVNNAGKYEIEVTPYEPQDSEVFNFYIEVRPQEIDFSDASAFNFVDAVNSNALSGDITTIYKQKNYSEGAKWYLTQDSDKITVDIKTVTNSYILESSSLNFSIKIEGENLSSGNESETSEYPMSGVKFGHLSVTERTNVSHTGSGNISASFKFAIPEGGSDTYYANNYKFVYGDETKLSDAYRGVSITDNSESSFTLTKQWYILDSYSFIYDERAEANRAPYYPFTIANKPDPGEYGDYDLVDTITYNDDIVVATPAFHIDEQLSYDKNGIYFALDYLPLNANKKVAIKERTALSSNPENTLEYYVNASMPAGLYTLTIYGYYETSEGDAVTPKEISNTYTLNVLPKELDKQKVENIYNALDKDFTVSLDVEGNVTHIHDDIGSYVSEFETVFGDDRKAGVEDDNYWTTSDADKYFSSAITVLYNRADWDKSNYVTWEVIKTTLSAKTYTFYYSLSAKNYVTAGGPDAANREYYTFKTTVEAADNGWESIPTMSSWIYGNFNSETNLILFKLKKNGEGITAYFRIGAKGYPANSADNTWTQEGEYYWLDVGGADSVSGTHNSTYFTVTDGKVDEKVAKMLNKLDAGTYYLDSYVTGANPFGTDNYCVINVAKAQNSWESYPYLSGWTYGSFDENFFQAGKAVFDERAEIKYVFELISSESVTDVEPIKIEFTSSQLDTVYTQLSSCNIGEYTFTAELDESTNYSGLSYSTKVWIVKGADRWGDRTPDIKGWVYGAFDESYITKANVEIGSDADIKYSIQYVNPDNDSMGENVPGYSELSPLSYEVLISRLKAPETALPAGRYNLTVKEGNNTNYDGVVTRIRFTVSPANNEWSSQPSVRSWIYGESNDEDFNALLNASIKFGLSDYTITYSINGTDEVNGTYSKDVQVNVSDGRDTSALLAVLKDLYAGSYTITLSVPESANYNALSTSLSFTVTKAQNGWVDVNSITRSYEVDYKNKRTLIDLITPAAARHGETVFTYEGNKTTIKDWVNSTPAGIFTINMLVEEVPGKYNGVLPIAITVIINGSDSSWHDWDKDEDSIVHNEDLDTYPDLVIEIPRGDNSQGETTYHLTFVKYDNSSTLMRDYNGDMLENVKTWLSSITEAGTITIVADFEPIDEGYSPLKYTITINISRIKLELVEEFDTSYSNLYGAVEPINTELKNAGTDYRVSEMVTFSVMDPNGRPVENTDGLSLIEFLNKLNAVEGRYYTVTMTARGNDRYQPLEKSFRLNIAKNANNNWKSDDGIDWINGYTWQFTRGETSFDSIKVPVPDFGEETLEIRLDGVKLDGCKTAEDLKNYLKDNKLSAGEHSLQFIVPDTDNYNLRTSTCSIVIVKIQNSWTESTEALGHNISRKYGEDLSDLRFIPFAHGDAGKVEITLNGVPVTDIAAYVKANGAGVYILVATLAEDEDYATLTYSITLEITTAFNGWGEPSEDGEPSGTPHFTGEVDKIEEDGETVYVWKYGTSVSAIASSLFGDVTVKYYEYSKAKALGTELPSMPTNVGMYVAVFSVASPDTGDFEALSSQLIFRIDQSKLETWTTSPYVAGWIWGGYIGSTNTFTAIAQSGGTVSFEILNSDGKTEVHRFYVVNGVPGDYYDSNLNAINEIDAISAIKNLVEGTYILRTWVDATTNYEGFTYEGYQFRVTQAQNTWITTPQIVSWSQAAWKAETNMPKAQTQYGTAEIVVTNNTTGEIFFNGTSDANGYYTAKNELESAGAGWYTMTVTVPGEAGKYTELGRVELSFMVFEAGSSSNFWTANPAMQGWTAEFDDEGDAIYNMPTATALRGKLYFRFFKVGEDGDYEAAVEVTHDSEIDHVVINNSNYAKAFYIPTEPGTYYMVAYAEDEGNADVYIESTRVPFTVKYREISWNADVSLIADTLYLGEKNTAGWGIPSAEATLASAKIRYEFYVYNDDGTRQSLGDTCPREPGKYYVSAFASAPYCEVIEISKAFEVKLSTNRWTDDTSPTIESWSEEFNSTSPDPVGSVEGGKKITYTYVNNKTGEVLTEKPTAAGSYTLVATVEEEGYETLVSRYEFTIEPAFDAMLLLICTILAFFGCALTVVVIIFAIRRNREN